MSKLLTVKEVAALTGKSVACVHTWVRRGLPVKRKSGSRYLIHKDDLEAWLQTRKPPQVTLQSSFLQSLTVDDLRRVRHDPLDSLYSNSKEHTVTLAQFRRNRELNGYPVGKVG